MKYLQILGLVASAAHAAERPLPEPLIGETVTDIDRDAPGELELELNTGRHPLRADPAQGMEATLEAEWRPLRRLGVAVEFGPSLQQASRLWSGRAAASWALHPSENFHVQLEGAVQTGSEMGAELPGGPALAGYVGARAGGWVGVVALRAGAGVSLGRGHQPRAAGYGTLAALVLLPGESYTGLESGVDFARQDRLVLAPHLTWSAQSWAVPLRLQLSVPVQPGQTLHVGVLFRVLWEFDRD